MKRSWLIAGVTAIALTSLGYWLGGAHEVMRARHEAYSAVSRELVSNHLSMQFLLSMLKQPCADELTPQLERELASQVSSVYGALAANGTLLAPDTWRLVKPMLSAAAYFRGQARHQETVRQAQWVVARLAAS